MSTQKRYALLSVSDKAEIVTLAQGLIAHGIEIVSTGGTAKTLKEAEVAVIQIDEYTGFPEMMDGRVKTFHPLVYGGILGRLPTDLEIMTEHGIVSIDFVVVNLYPFSDTVAKPDCTFDVAIENIDIGGPTMLRAAAKNHSRVTALCDPHDYERVLSEMKSRSGHTSEITRLALAKKVFRHTYLYDRAISEYLVDK